jgi:hypothetical protein
MIGVGRGGVRDTHCDDRDHEVDVVTSEAHGPK